MRRVEDGANCDTGRGTLGAVSGTVETWAGKSASASSLGMSMGSVRDGTRVGCHRQVGGMRKTVEAMNTSMKPLSIAERIEIVRWAIALIETRRAVYLKSEHDPESTSAERTGHREAFYYAEREFGWQWKNVKAILEEYCK